MSNEERLQNIKFLMETGHLIQLRKGKETYDTVNWLIQQAEQKLHLEMKYENTGSTFGRQNQRLLIEENKGLRKALEESINLIALQPLDPVMLKLVDIITKALKQSK